MESNYHLDGLRKLLAYLVELLRKGEMEVSLARRLSCEMREGFNRASYASSVLVSADQELRNFDAAVNHIQADAFVRAVAALREDTG